MIVNIVNFQLLVPFSMTSSLVMWKTVCKNILKTEKAANTSIISTKILLKYMGWHTSCTSGSKILYFIYVRECSFNPVDANQSKSIPSQ